MLGRKGELVSSRHHLMARPLWRWLSLRILSRRVIPGLRIPRFSSPLQRSLPGFAAYHALIRAVASGAACAMLLMIRACRCFMAELGVAMPELHTARTRRYCIARSRVPARRLPISSA